MLILFRSLFFSLDRMKATDEKILGRDWYLPSPFSKQVINSTNSAQIVVFRNMGPLGLPALQGVGFFLLWVQCGSWKSFFRFFLIRRCDCVGVGFPILSSLIGSEKSRLSLNQSDAKLKQIPIWSSAFFSRFRQFACFQFEFSLALKGIFFSSVWRHLIEKCSKTLNRKALH